MLHYNKIEFVVKCGLYGCITRMPIYMKEVNKSDDVSGFQKYS